LIEQPFLSIVRSEFQQVLFHVMCRKVSFAKLLFLSKTEADVMIEEVHAWQDHNPQ